GVIGSMDGYQLPDAKGHTALMRYLHGTTDDYRQRIRDEVLSTTLADLHSFADVLDEIGKNGRIVVVGSTSDIEAANQADSLGLETLALM
ncbi:MAG: Zn-dependent M16 (insulinase) family peptidase, partial [Cellvibrionaceae bacterium]